MSEVLAVSINTPRRQAFVSMLQKGQESPYFSDTLPGSPDPGLLIPLSANGTVLPAETNPGNDGYLVSFAPRPFSNYVGLTGNDYNEPLLESIKTDFRHATTFCILQNERVSPES